MQNVFGYLDNSVESSLAKKGSSKVCKNIDVTKGYIDSNFDSRNSVEYLQSCTMFKREYSIDDNADIVRADGTTVGVEILPFPLSIEKATSGGVGSGLVDPWEALKLPLFRLMWYELYGAYPTQANIDTYIDKMEKTGLYLYPIYKVIYNDGEVDETYGCVSFGDEIVGTKIALQDNFWYRSDASITGFPSYSDTVQFIVDNTLQREYVSGDYAVDMTNANLTIKGNKWLDGTGSFVSSALAGTPTKSIDKIEIWVEQSFKGKFSAVVPNHYGSYFCRIAELDYSADPITTDGEMPESIDISFAEVTDGLANDDIKFLSSTLRKDCGASYTTYPAIEFDEVEVGTLEYVFTNKQIPYDDATDYYIESIPSDPLKIDVYADDTNKSFKLTLQVGLGTYNNDGAGDVYWNVNDTNAQYLRIYRREPTQSQYYLLTEINLQELPADAPTPVVKKYDDAGYETENSDVYDDSDDGTENYLKVIIVDNMLPLDDQEYLSSDNNYPPNYNVETGEEYGDVAYILTHNNRLFYAVDNILFFSAVDEPEYYYPANFITFNHNITGLASFNEVLYIGTETGVYVLYGNGAFENYTLKEVDKDVTCLANSMISCPYGCFFVSNGDGVYRINGSNVEKISDELGETAEASMTEINNCEWVDNRFLVWETQETDTEEDTFTFYRFDCKLGGWSTGAYSYALGTTDILPTLASDDATDKNNASKNDYVFLSSNSYTNFDMYKMFDDNIATHWKPATWDTSGRFVRIKLPDTSTKIIYAFTLMSNSSTETPKKLRLRAFNEADASDIVTLQTWEDQTFTANVKKTFTVDTETHYTYYQINIDEINGSTVQISEIELLEKTLATDNYTEWQSNDITFEVPHEAKEFPRMFVEYEGTVDLELYKNDTKTVTKSLSSTTRKHEMIYTDNKKFHRMNYKIILKDTNSKFYSIDIPAVKK